MIISTFACRANCSKAFSSEPAATENVISCCADATTELACARLKNENAGNVNNAR